MRCCGGIVLAFRNGTRRHRAKYSCICFLGLGCGLARRVAADPAVAAGSELSSVCRRPHYRRHPELLERNLEPPVRARRSLGAPRIQRCRVTWTQLAFENTDENFSIRHLGENLAPILFAKKFPCCFISQRQNAKHGDVVSRRGNQWCRCCFDCLRAFALWLW